MDVTDSKEERLWNKISAEYYQNQRKCSIDEFRNFLIKKSKMINQHLKSITKLSKCLNSNTSIIFSSELINIQSNINQQVKSLLKEITHKKLEKDINEKSSKLNETINELLRYYTCNHINLSKDSILPKQSNKIKIKEKLSTNSSQSVIEINNQIEKNREILNKTLGFKGILNLINQTNNK